MKGHKVVAEPMAATAAKTVDHVGLETSLAKVRQARRAAGAQTRKKAPTKDGVGSHAKKAAARTVDPREGGRPRLELFQPGQALPRDGLHEGEVLD